MTPKHIAIAALTLGLSGSALAYDTGKLSCDNVGQLAAQMLKARQSGVPPEAYLQALDQRLPAEARTERRLALEIAKVVYTNDELGQMQPEQAYLAFSQDCTQRQQDDSSSGQAAPDQQDQQGQQEQPDQQAPGSPAQQQDGGQTQQ
jgi:hypothetical protein